MESILIAAEQGAEPKALLDRPELYPGSDFYFNTFQDLQSDRPVGFSRGSIPWSSIKSYAQTHGIEDPDELGDLVAVIRAVEREIDIYENSKTKG